MELGAKAGLVWFAGIRGESGMGGNKDSAVEKRDLGMTLRGGNSDERRPSQVWCRVGQPVSRFVRCGGA